MNDLHILDKRICGNFSHMEQFDHAVNEDFKETKTILLFDYQNRDPLTNQATVYPITMNLIKKSIKI
mgnify:CR=1 FL=1